MKGYFNTLFTLLLGKFRSIFYGTSYSNTAYFIYFINFALPLSQFRGQNGLYPNNCQNNTVSIFKWF